MKYAQARHILDGWFLGEMVDWRKFKRAERIAFKEGVLFKAYCRGLADKRTVNPFPPGKRHDQWAKGTNHAEDK